MNSLGARVTIPFVCFCFILLNINEKGGARPGYKSLVLQKVKGEGTGIDENLCGCPISFCSVHAMTRAAVLAVFLPILTK